MAPQQQMDVTATPRATFTLSHATAATLLAKPKTTDDEVCLYPSKKCTNRRAKKKNGELHTMCEYHRIRANENQRRLERRRKAALRFPQRHTPKPTLWNRGFPDPQPLPLPPFPLPEPKALEPAARQPDLLTHWQPIEIEILMACLFDTVEIPMCVPPPAPHCWPVLIHAAAPPMNLAQFV